MCQVHNHQSVAGSILRFGSSKQCRICAAQVQGGRPITDITGQVIGKWKVLRRIPLDQRPLTDKNQCWICQCVKCGRERKSSATQLNRLDGCRECAADRRRLKPYEMLYNAAKYRIVHRLDSSKTHVFTLSFKSFCEFIASGKCHYCWAPIQWSKHNISKNGSGHHVDRKDNRKGYIKSNCVPCCTRCNYGKGARFSYEEWLGMTEYFRSKL